MSCQLGLPLFPINRLSNRRVKAALIFTQHMFDAALVCVHLHFVARVGERTGTIARLNKRNLLEEKFGKGFPRLL